MNTFLWSAAALALVLLVLAPIFDRVVLPEPAPGPEFHPPVGATFRSESEGFTQRILARKDGMFWLELTMRPHAPGPPPHIHTTFPERFRVERGIASIRLADRTVELHPGEEYLVPPGIEHQPFNATGEEVVVVGPITPDYAIPERFSVFLTQAYGFFDARPENRAMPRAMLQLSRFAPVYDSWIAGPPIALQRALFWVLGPIARVLGYRTHYPQFAPAASICVHPR